MTTLPIAKYQPLVRQCFLDKVSNITVIEMKPREKAPSWLSVLYIRLAGIMLHLTPDVPSFPAF